MCTKFDPVASFFSTHRRGWYSELSRITPNYLTQSAIGYMSLDTLVSSLTGKCEHSNRIQYRMLNIHNRNNKLTKQSCLIMEP